MAELRSFNPVANLLQGQELGIRRNEFDRFKQLQQVEDQQQGQSDELKKIQFLNQAAKGLLNVPPEQRLQAFEQLKPFGAKLGIDVNSIDARNINDQSLQQLIQSTEPLLQDARNQVDPAGVREFEAMTQGMTPEEKQNARRVWAGLDPRAGSITGKERIAVDETLGGQVASQVGREAGAAQGAKNQQDLQYKPEIARQVELAKLRGQAEFNLPTALGNRDRVLKTIDDLIQHPGREPATGLSSISNFFAIPGGDRKDFLVKLDQAQGQIFSIAYETLKGGGQITEYEGKKAAQALENLETAQSEEQFLAALEDFRYWTEVGYLKLQEKAGVNNASRETPQNNSFTSKSGITFTVD